LCLSFFNFKNEKRRRIQSPGDELFRILNNGGNEHNVPLTPLENHSIRKIIQEHPETCREKYYALPFTWLCLRHATIDVIELAYNTHPQAIHEAEEESGWSPLHSACYKKAPLEVVQFLVERNPVALETADNNGQLPLHLACRFKASLDVVQYLVERNPVALETAGNNGC
jgi:hypothetical protein